MKISIRKGFGFGMTSGIITTLGLMIGLYSGTNSRLFVLGGILMVAIADAFSDSLGIHISEEAGSKKTTTKEIWESTISTFVFKFVFALVFIIPVLFLELRTAVIIGVFIGLFLLGAFSFYIAKQRSIKPLKIILEHLGIAVLVIIITYFVGKAVSVLV